MDCSPPGPSVHGISQARILEVELVDISFSKESSWPTDWICISCTGRWILYCWASREAQYSAAHWCKSKRCIFVTDVQSLVTLGFSSVQFSRSVMSDSLQPHEPQHARPPCPSPTPRVHPNPCPLRQWCHPTISSSVVPFSSCPQSFPASGSFQMSQLSVSSGQSIGVSGSTSVLPMNTEDWSPLGWTVWISLQSKGLARVFSNTTVQKHQFFGAQAFFIVQLSHPYPNPNPIGMFDTLQPHGLQHVRLPCPSLSQLVQTHVHWVDDAIQSPHPLLPPFPPALNLSQHQSLFQWVSSSHHVAKVYWSFTINPSNGYSGLISFRIGWFDLLAVQRTGKSL